MRGEDRGALLQDGQGGNRAVGEFLLQQVEEFLFGAENGVAGGDLGVVAGQGDGGGDDVALQGVAGGFELGFLVVVEGGAVFKRVFARAEQARVVGNGAADCIDRVGRKAIGAAGLGGAGELGLAGVEADLRQVGTVIGDGVLLRGDQVGVGFGQSGACR